MINPPSPFLHDYDLPPNYISDSEHSDSQEALQPNQSIGDTLLPATPDTLRIMFQNVNGINLDKDGGDLDRDGWIDNVNDLCPPDPNADPSTYASYFNEINTDFDGDGIGDACDVDGGDVDGDGYFYVSDNSSGTNDNCPNTTLSVTPNSFECEDLQISPVVVTLTITDASGNSANCTATITVQDLL